MEHEALALQDKGEYKAAEELFRNCLSERQRALGADHIDTLAAMNNLANLLHDRGENLEAETLHQQVLEARECLRGRVPLSRIARGSRNFTGWESSRNLARALRVFSASESQREDIAARRLAFQLIAGARRTLAPNHPDRVKYQQLLDSLR